MELKYIAGFLILTVTLTWSAVESVKRRKNLSGYWARNCAGRKWKARFSDASKEEIRTFLKLFVGAFMFEEKQSLVFAPDDKLMDIYQALYPPKWSFADALETETFVKELKGEYGVDIVPLWRDGMTLGDIFEVIHRA